MIPAAADLYSLPIGEFTAERDRLARRLADEGSKEDAVAVSRLRKPTTTPGLSTRWRVRAPS